MRNISIAYIASLLLFAGCSAKQHTTEGMPSNAPSSNTQLNSLSPNANSNDKPDGFLQKGYDYWEQTDWLPNTEGSPAETPTAAPQTEASSLPEEPDAEVTEPPAEPEPDVAAEVQSAEAPAADTNATVKDDGNEASGLQYYVDKWRRYLDAKEKQRTEPPMAEKLDAMPGIGKEQ